MNAARRSSSSLTEVSKAPSNLVFFGIPLSSFLGLLLLCFKVFVELACIIMAVSSLYCWYCDINSVLLVDV